MVMSLINFFASHQLPGRSLLGETMYPYVGYTATNANAGSGLFCSFFSYFGRHTNMVLGVEAILISLPWLVGYGV